MRSWFWPGLAVLLSIPSTAPTARAANADPVAAHDDSVETALRATVTSGTLAGLRWPRFPPYRDELEALYSKSAWRPVWTVQGRPTPAAQAAIDALRNAGERGLHPDDYDATLLERRSRELAAARFPTARDVAWFDAALSVGFLRHVWDVHVGRVNPQRISIGINVEPKKRNFAAELRQAIDAGRVAEMVRDIEPRFIQYRNMKSAYAHYRTLALDPAPPPVLSAKPVRPGGHFAGAMALRRRLGVTGDLPAADVRAADTTLYDGALAGAVSRFQERHGLAPDSVLGPSTLAAVNVPFARRARQLELAMERIRWLPEPAGPFLVVNVPSFQLYGFDTLRATGVPDMTMNVVVGRDQVGRQTPLFERDMRYIVLRPYWVIPRGILRKETLPAVRRNHGYLARNNMEIYSGSGDTGPAVPTTSANIERVARGELGIRQRPGPKNSLGLAKFIFPNDHNVYLHGTPATELFSRARRDFSHGCVRVEDPERLAVWVLRDPRQWPTEQVRRAMQGERPRVVNLSRPLPVVIYYSTAVVRTDGTVAFYDDVYRHDATLESALAKGYPFPP